MAFRGDKSHLEVWDDSLLVNSWNEALDEYKKYHSIHARGERVEEVLLAAAEPKNGVSDASASQDATQISREYENAPNKVSDEMTRELRPSNPTAPPTESQMPHQGSDGAQSKAPVLPTHLIGQVHDESLKNLLMSWYYAGYYTGLYEGQQQGARSQGV